MTKDYEDHQNHVLNLIEKAAKAHTSEDAIRFSQAACNSGNALNVLITIKARNN